MRVFKQLADSVVQCETLADFSLDLVELKRTIPASHKIDVATLAVSVFRADPGAFALELAPTTSRVRQDTDTLSLLRDPRSSLAGRAF